MKRDVDPSDFDAISWHDDEIHAIRLSVGDPDRGDWTSDLVLDIDHIVEWVREDQTMSFRVAPATLVFHGVTDLRVEIDSGTSGLQVSLALPSISEI